MPSPFPGMDPWLEDPAIFPDLHYHFITRLADAVNDQLPAPYYAAVANRVWVELSFRFVEPDVNVLYPAARPTKKSGTSKKSRTSVKPSSECVVIEAPLIFQDDDMEESFLEIFSKPGNEGLVTSVELLSLANKKESSRGRELFLKKQEEIKNGRANLVEIDLLRGGLHSSIVPHALVEARFGSFDYHVCIQRMDEKDRYRVYPWRLAEILPTIEIPLLPGHPSVVVELQVILNACYDKAKYERRVPYRTRKPKPRLTKEQREWAEGILKAHNL